MKSLQIARRLDDLLSEAPASVVHRERHALDEKIGGLDRDFLLFGAGNLGRKALRTLKRMGRSPIGFIDNNPSLWGTRIDGIPIMSPADAAKAVDPQDVGVITTIWCGEATDKMSDRLGPLGGLGFTKIALFGHLAWKFPDEFLPHYCLDRPSKVIQQASSVRAAFELMADDESQEMFVNHVQWRLFLDYDLLPPPSSEEIYFNPRFASRDDAEVLYDIGAYTGDSVESFLRSARGARFSQIHSFEPSPNNFLRLEQYVASLGALEGRVFAHRLALGDAIGTIQVETGHGPASRVGAGSETVPLTTIDEFSKSLVPPSFIKIDIEGFEPDCLRGGRRIIAETGPVVAVCVYHAQSHLWDIALQLHAYHPHYRFSLCPHLADGWDLVLYAVPKNRLPA